ncbi:ribosomal protein S5 domain 2-type protein [Lipomyces japonicus]|uniref:ribosomal protein S5 domain 2-type protein n=1 Tax=Lipomyces japonicus TaxID=56871 RepID=UPI0034CD1B96
MPLSPPFLVSAPGKVILFGEHAAVYGKPAIAAAVSLRSYLLVTENTTDRAAVALEFPDVGFRHAWPIASLPWAAVHEHNHNSAPPTELNQALATAIDRLLSTPDIKTPTERASALAFLYLFLSLCEPSTPGFTVAVRSTLPIGAGLGSSASISVSLAAAFGLLSGRVEPPTPSSSSPSPSFSSSFIPENIASIELIDAWAFLGERCIHGNPSGIDNAVASHGGAVMFQRTQAGNPNLRESIRDFPPLRLLLVDSRQSRHTAVQVAAVADLVRDHPVVADAILTAIHDLTKEAYELLLRPPEHAAAEEDKNDLENNNSSTAWAQRLRNLVRINHGLLVALGVSHPKLEIIRAAADELGIGQTKLTGAGGGGCAITLVNDKVSHQSIDQLRNRLQSQGFVLFETKLGGQGAGCLLPSQTAEFEDWEAKIFNSDNLLALSGKDDIETHVGVDSKLNWEFW